MMSATEIMFRLHQVYQERRNLLRHLTDPKVGTNLCDALQTLRLWRRWLARAEELDVALPDGLVLITVLGKIAEVVGKTRLRSEFLRFGRSCRLIFGLRSGRSSSLRSTCRLKPKSSC